MYYTDSHIHLQDYKSQEVKNIVTAAKKNNVRRLVNASAHPRDWEMVQKLATEYPDTIIPAFGVHPWHIDAAPADWAEQLEQILAENPAALVGECGIDRLKNTDVAAQSAILQKHIGLAQKYRRPLIIHAVKAVEVLQNLLAFMPACTIFHSYAGPAEWGRQIQAHGYFIGLNFALLRKQNAAELVRALDITRILLETDGPYQSGEKNRETLPANLPLLAAQIAAWRGIAPEELAEILYRNWLNFTGEK